MTQVFDLNDPWLERRHTWHPKKREARTPFEIDHSRIIHSSSFRRLEGKSQILGIGDGQQHRTRMTHSLEVDQVAGGLMSQLRADYADNEEVLALLPNRDMLRAICLVHDLGHPPHGHGGEVALNFAMERAGGYEGNGHTIRLLTKLEDFHDEGGSNLTRRTLLGTLKYPVPYSAVAKEPQPPTRSPISGELLLTHKHHEPPKCYLDTETDVVAWLLAPLSAADRQRVISTRAKSSDCSLMDQADDIAYGVHDLEDMIDRKLVSKDQMLEDIPVSVWEDFLETIRESYPQAFSDPFRTPYEAFVKGLFTHKDTKKWIGRLVGYMIDSVVMKTRPEFESPLYRYEVSLRAPALQLLKALKKFILDRVIRSPGVQQLRFKGQTLIMQLFGRLAHDPRHLLPTEVYALYPKDGPTHAQMRVICDYIASMTDLGLVAAWNRLFSPNAGSVHDFL